jgi:BlaI family transcriptional regulator, penicillinase repressor
MTGRDAIEANLTGLQLAIMQVLWERGEATVGEVQEALEPARPLAQSTIATVLSRLAKRGVVTHRSEGRQYVYRPLLSAARARGTALAEVAEGLFAGDVATLVSELLSSRDVDRGDLEKVRALIEAKERELAGRKS